jgi:hypothetical protein
MLGVVTGRAVEIRQAPNPLGVPPSVADAPDIDATIQALNDQYSLDMSDELRGQPLEPPGWLDEAWRRAETRPWLAAAAVTYSEGLLLEDAHPSLAGVAFISAIEAIAYRTHLRFRCAPVGNIET